MPGDARPGDQGTWDTGATGRRSVGTHSRCQAAGPGVEMGSPEQAGDMWHCGGSRAEASGGDRRGLRT